MKKICENCRYWQESSIDSSTQRPPVMNGWCHRFPPQPHFNDRIYWPLAYGDGWCGEFKPKAGGKEER